MKDRCPASLCRPVALLVIPCLWLLAALPAGAHGVVERSSPASGAALDAAPSQVELWFNEPVDPAFSSASVVDPFGKRVSGRSVISADGRRMTVPLRELPRGFYTVRWRVLSATDGHTTAGAFAFTVGVPGRPPVAGGSEAPDPWLALVRWAGYLAAVLLAGAALFSPLVLRPGLRSVEPPTALRVQEAAAARLRRLTAGAALAVVAVGAVELALRATALVEASLGQVIAGGHLFLMLWSTKPGWSVLVRAAFAVPFLLPTSPRGRILRAAWTVWFMVVGGLTAMLGGPAAVAGSSHLVLVVLVAGVHGLLTVLILIVLPQMPDFRDIRVPEMRWVPPVAGAGVLLGLTINSHAWGSGAPAVLADWAHMAAAAVWIGGLACLLVVLTGMPPPERARASPALVPRMSTAAAVALGLLVATGVYGAWLHVPGPTGLVASAYGRALLVKLVLFAPLVMLGAFNRFVLRPRLAADDPAHRRLLKTVGGEVGLGAVVLLVVAVLTVIPPARVTLGISPATNLRLAGLAGDVRLSLMVEPVLPGPNQIEVTVLAGDGRPIEADARAMVRLTRLDEDLVPTTLVLESRGQGRYSAAGGAIMPEGWWEAAVVLRRRGRLDVSTAFPLRIGRPRAAASDPDALRLLDASRAAMGNLRAWREEEQIADGAGGTVTVEVDLVRPDRLRYRTSGGDEGIIIGVDRYRRTGEGAWERDTLPRPLAADGVLQYLRGAEAVVLGRGAHCEAELCRVVSWEAPGRTAAFAAWVGEESRRIHRLMMVAPFHYMTSRVFGFDAPVKIEPPR